MLLEFSVANFRSFGKKRTFTMQASTSIKDFPDNVSHVGGYNVLRTAAIYGANSSGKSNLVKAWAAMGNMVVKSVKLNNEEELKPHSPFLLSQNLDDEPTFFEIIFIEGGICYRYGFEYNRKEIVSEWLFSKQPKKKEKALFVRDYEGIGVSESDFKEGVGLEERTNDNRLFISLVSQLGGAISNSIVKWFDEKFGAISGIDSDFFNDRSKRMFHKKLVGYAEALELFKKTMLGFNNVFTKESEFDPETLPKNLPEALRKEFIENLSKDKVLNLLSVHNKYDDSGSIIGEVSFDVEKNESAGTQKLINLSEPIFSNLLRGEILIIDELDCKMHPLLSDYIVRLFNAPNTNPNHAQLIFTTHDTNLLSSGMFRRDQIWFTEKDNCEQTDLYTLNDIVLPNGSKPRNDSNYEKNYITGRYGAIPYIK